MNTFNHRQDCWYKDVCQIPSCDGCIRFSEMKFLLDNSNIPKNKQIGIKLQPTTPKDKESFKFLATILDNIVSFVEQGKNLYICGRNTGCGKTSWSLKLILRYFNNIWSGNGYKVRGMFIHVPTFLNQLKDFNNPLSEEYKNNIMSCDLVVWDEIASKTATEYEYNQLLMFLDNRIINGKSNIFTSNITKVEELNKLFDARLVSRVYRNSIIVELEGKDWRGLNK